MKYKSRHRRKPIYNELIGECKDFLQSKLKHKTLEFATKVKVAFAFRSNGEAIIKAYKQKLELPNGRLLTLDKSLIATNKANYTCACKLRERFGLG